MPSLFEKKIISMLRAIHEKPKPVRQMYALMAAGGVTSVVVLVWLTAIIFAGYYPTMTPLKKEQLSAAVQTSQENVSAFKNEFTKQIQTSSAHEQVNKLLEEFKQQKEQAAVAFGQYASTSVTISDDNSTTSAFFSDPNTDPNTENVGAVTPPPPVSSADTDMNTNIEYERNY
jgi:hypothetical protein